MVDHNTGELCKLRLTLIKSLLQSVINIVEILICLVKMNNLSIGFSSDLAMDINNGRTEKLRCPKSSRPAELRRQRRAKSGEHCSLMILS